MFFTRRLIPLYIALIVFASDQLSKWLVHTYLPLMKHHWLWYPYGGIGIFKNFFGIEFSISHQVNHGAAWGAFSNFQLPLLCLRIALTLFLIIYVLFINKQTRWEIPFALIIGGAFGNIVDYFHYGHVVDMLHFVLWGYDFPVFNVADSAIFAGITWLIISSSFTGRVPIKKRR